MTGPVAGIRRRRTVAGRRETPHLPPDRDFYGQTLIKLVFIKWFDSSVGRSFQISYIYNAVINKLCKSQSGMVKRDCVYVNVEANNK